MISAALHTSGQVSVADMQRRRERQEEEEIMKTGQNDGNKQL